jgi:hypothetical protein
MKTDRFQLRLQNKNHFTTINAMISSITMKQKTPDKKNYKLENEGYVTPSYDRTIRTIQFNQVYLCADSTA